MSGFTKYLAALAIAVPMVLPLPGLAQSDETLADIRQELSVLSVEIQKLKRELSTTGGSGNAALGATLLERTNNIEQEMQRLTAKTEDLELRVNRVVSDGSNRIGDLEYRLCELESACDPAKLGQGKPLGGQAVAVPVTPVVPARDTGAPELAANEKADFDRARQTFDSGDAQAAATLLKGYRETYPGGPFSSDAGLLLGEALKTQGDRTGAARAWLDTFGEDPKSAVAPEAVLRLGVVLGELGKVDEACLTLGEIPARFPGTPQVGGADAAMKALNCP